ncbi:hypothetical protein BC830DRAFT_1093848 [Chytriomyces sp. MP71]|nr:hypothetical protein BC830DRAFT_1093848 [Chytriomyces sp. MP71]
MALDMVPTEVLQGIRERLHPDTVKLLGETSRTMRGRLSLPVTLTQSVRNLRFLSSDERASIDYARVSSWFAVALFVVDGFNLASLAVLVSNECKLIGNDDVINEAGALPFPTSNVPLVREAMLALFAARPLRVDWARTDFALAVRIASVSGWDNVLVAMASAAPHLLPLHASAALDYAASQGHASIVQLLLNLHPPHNHSVSLAFEDASPFRHACANGHADVAAALLDARSSYSFNVAARDNFALIRASANGFGPVVSILLKRCANELDPAAFGSLALQLAVDGGHSTVVQLLLEDGRADWSILGQEYQEVLLPFIEYLKARDLAAASSVSNVVIMDSDAISISV